MKSAEHPLVTVNLTVRTNKFTGSLKNTFFKIKIFAVVLFQDLAVASLLVNRVESGIGSENS